MSLSRRQAVLFALSMATASVAAKLLRAPAPDPAKGEGLLLSSIFPRHFGEWSIDPDSHSIVRTASGRDRILQAYDQLLELTFANTDGYRIMLSVAGTHGTSASMGLHLPEVCYSASGYRVSDMKSETLNVLNRELAVRTLRADLPGRAEPVTYWSVVGNRVVTHTGLDGFGSWEFRWHRMRHALRRELMTGILVRISSIDPQVARAHGVQARFADAMVGAIDAAHHPKLLGALV